MIYGGGFNNWAKDNSIEKEELDIIKQLRGELSCIKLKIVELNPLIHSEIKKEKKKENKNTYEINNTILSYYIQEIENRILETIYSYCKENGYISNDVCCLCYDGLMLEKSKFNPELLQIFNILILEKFGLDLKFDEKKMANYLDILDDHQKEDNEDTESHVGE